MNKWRYSGQQVGWIEERQKRVDGWMDGKPNKLMNGQWRRKKKNEWTEGIQ